MIPSICMDVRHESLLHPTSIALEVGDRVDGLWMGWEGSKGSHLLLEEHHRGTYSIEWKVTGE
jgi:hypothetical protein